MTTSTSSIHSPSSSTTFEPTISSRISYITQIALEHIFYTLCYGYEILKNHVFFVETIGNALSIQAICNLKERIFDRPRQIDACIQMLRQRLYIPELDGFDCIKKNIPELDGFDCIKKTLENIQPDQFAAKTTLICNFIGDETRRLMSLQKVLFIINAINELTIEELNDFAQALFIWKEIDADYFIDCADRLLPSIRAWPVTQRADSAHFIKIILSHKLGQSQFALPYDFFACRERIIHWLNNNLHVLDCSLKEFCLDVPTIMKQIDITTDHKYLITYLECLRHLVRIPKSHRMDAITQTTILCKNIDGASSNQVSVYLDMLAKEYTTYTADRINHTFHMLQQLEIPAYSLQPGVQCFSAETFAYLNHLSKEELTEICTCTKEITPDPYSSLRLSVLQLLISIQPHYRQHVKNLLHSFVVKNCKLYDFSSLIVDAIKIVEQMPNPCQAILWPKLADLASHENFNIDMTTQLSKTILYFLIPILSHDDIPHSTDMIEAFLRITDLIQNNTIAIDEQSRKVDNYAKTFDYLLSIKAKEQSVLAIMNANQLITEHLDAAKIYYIISKAHKMETPDTAILVRALINILDPDLLQDSQIPINIFMQSINMYIGILNDIMRLANGNHFDIHAFATEASCVLLPLSIHPKSNYNNSVHLMANLLLFVKNHGIQQASHTLSSLYRISHSNNSTLHNASILTSTNCVTHITTTSQNLTQKLIQYRENYLSSTLEELEEEASHIMRQQTFNHALTTCLVIDKYTTIFFSAPLQQLISTITKQTKLFQCSILDNENLNSDYMFKIRMHAFKIVQSIVSCYASSLHNTPQEVLVDSANRAIEQQITNLMRRGPHFTSWQKRLTYYKQDQ